VSIRTSESMVTTFGMECASLVVGWGGIFAELGGFIRSRRLGEVQIARLALECSSTCTMPDSAVIPLILFSNGDQ